MRARSHSPAPWTVMAETTASGTVYRIMRAGGLYLDGTESQYEASANRALIEAAPLLLDALQWQEMAEADAAAAQRKSYFDRARELRRSAIAKAHVPIGPTEGGAS